VFFGGLDYHPAPFMEGDFAVQNGQVIQLPGFGPVRFQVFPDQLEIINETMPGHMLAPGYVDRQVVQIGDDVFIRTYGVGTGPYGDLNSGAASAMWHSVDAQIARSLMLYPPTIIHP